MELLAGWVLLNTWNFGMCSLMLYYRTLKISITGSLKPQDFFPPDLRTELSLLDLWALSHGNGFGNLGLPVNVKPLFGWPFVTDVGQLIACKKEGSLTLIVARCVTKKKRQSNTCSLRVCSPDSFGSAFSSP